MNGLTWGACAVLLHLDGRHNHVWILVGWFVDFLEALVLLGLATRVGMEFLVMVASSVLLLKRPPWTCCWRCLAKSQPSPEAEQRWPQDLLSGPWLPGQARVRGWSHCLWAPTQLAEGFALLVDHWLSAPDSGSASASSTSLFPAFFIF
jgi:hypothetical protein